MTLARFTRELTSASLMSYPKDKLEREEAIQLSRVGNFSGKCTDLSRPRRDGLSSNTDQHAAQKLVT